MASAPATDSNLFSDAFDERDLAPRPGRGRRPRRSPRRKSGGRGRLRLFYFAIASIWGCILGAAALAIAAAWSGAAPGLDLPTVVALTGACALSVGGGIVAAKAYREAARRRS